MESGEVAGIADWSWSTFKVQRADWLRDGKARVLMQAALQPDPDLKDVPNAISFAKDIVTRSAMELYLSQKTIARPVAAPPDLPKEQADVLRAAFTALESDREFLDTVKKARVEVSILSGQAVADAIEKIGSAPTVEVGMALRQTMCRCRRLSKYY